MIDTSFCETTDYDTDFIATDNLETDYLESDIEGVRGCNTVRGSETPKASQST